MKRCMPVFLTIVLLFIVITGCDSFSLPDQFKLKLHLVLQKSTVKPGEECLLYPKGGTGPYTFEVIIDNVYDDGHASDPGTVVNQTYIAGNSIGEIIIRLIDSENSSDEVLITVVPWKPQNFTADGTAGSPTTVELTWTYDVPGYIEGFRILRASSGGTFKEIAGTDGSARNYTDTSASPQLNTYRLYAVAGEFLSAYAEVSAMGNPLRWPVSGGFQPAY